MSEINIVRNTFVGVPSLKGPLYTNYSPFVTFLCK